MCDPSAQGPAFYLELAHLIRSAMFFRWRLQDVLHDTVCDGMCVTVKELPGADDGRPSD